MMPIIILALSSFALIRFAISQWRAIWISAANQELSDSLQLAAGIDGASIAAQDFGTLMDLCDRLSPGLKQTSSWLREVSLYYRGISGVARVCERKLPALAAWAKREMQICSRYAAVVLDQNLSMNLDRSLAVRAN